MSLTASAQTTDIAIRDDLVEAHRYYWDHLSKPGTWWSGAERVAIARETRMARQCALCQQRKAALSPYGIDGVHDDSGSGLAPGVIDAAHRIATDAGRLTKSWFDSVIDDQFTDAHYAELLGIVSSVMSIDTIHIILGLPLDPLPESVPGEPSRQRPAGLEDIGGWVPVINPSKASSSEGDLFATRRASNVSKSLSLVPEEHRSMKRVLAAQYLPIELVPSPGENGGRAISRALMELVGARTSAINECFY